MPQGTTFCKRNGSNPPSLSSSPNSQYLISRRHQSSMPQRPSTADHLTNPPTLGLSSKNQQTSLIIPGQARPHAMARVFTTKVGWTHPCGSLGWQRSWSKQWNLYDKMIFIVSIALQMNHRRSITSLLLFEKVHKHLPTLLIDQVHIGNDVASFRSTDRSPSIVYSHEQVQSRKGNLAIHLVKALEDIKQVWSLWDVDEGGLWLDSFLPSDLPHYVGKSSLLLSLELLVAIGVSAELSFEDSALLLLWGLCFGFFGIWRRLCGLFWLFEGVWVKALVSLLRLIANSGLCIAISTFGGLFPSMVVGLMNSFFTSTSTFFFFLPGFPADGTTSHYEGSNSLFFVFRASSSRGVSGFPAHSASYLTITSLAA